jgi:PKD repeat protein
MHTSPYSPAHAGRRLLVAASLLTVLALTLMPARVWGSSGSQYGSIGQYGEVTRIGGFDSNAYDDGAYDKALTPGTFLNPVGFAVDTHDLTAGGDGTAIYVLDRVSDYAEATSQPGTEWRLQKLSDTDAPLGSTEFYLPKTPSGLRVPVGALGLAIDDTTGRIYTLIYGTANAENETPILEEIVGWSTTPVSGKLVAPGASGSYPALPSDSVSTPAAGYSAPGRLSTASQLASASLYDPQGLALDVTGGQDDLAIEANAAQGEEPLGPTVVQQVSTITGATASRWTSTSLTGLANASAADANAFAAGISTNPDGSLDVLLSTALGQADRDVVKLPADLSGPTVLDSSEVTDPADSWSKSLAANYAGARRSTSNSPASADSVALSNGLDASDYWLGGGVGYWNLAENEGVRLVSPEANGLLSNPASPVTSIFDTLGNSTAGGACNITDGGVENGANNLALAAGANGAVWVLTAGRDASRGDEPANLTGRQLIEFAPSAGTACVGPTGTFTVANSTSGSQPQAASTTDPLTVPVGATVEFDASTIGYPTSESLSQGAIYSYEWDPTGAGYSLHSYTEELRPPTTASFAYTTPGVYTVKLKLLGDFGEYDQTGTVVVQTGSSPVAAFTAPSTAQSGQAVTFDASGSQPASGAHIAAYHWNFGDGQTDDTQTSSEGHAYGSPGTYTATLTVRDNDNRQSAPVTQQITVSSPTQGGGGGGGTGTTSTGTSTAPPPAQADRSSTRITPKLAAAGTGVKVTVACPVTKLSCAGTLQVKTAAAVAASVAKATKQGKAKRKSVLVLGQTSFSLAGGRSETLTIRLSSKGLALLKKSKRLKVVVLVSAHDSFGDPGSVTVGLTLSEPSKKKK